MRHVYAGDVGDYVKYAVLRAVCTTTRLRLGVVWYLTDHPEERGDGRFRHHLTRDGWEVLDPGLLSELQRLDRAGLLTIDGIEASEALPTGTVFFSEPMPEAEAAAPMRAVLRAGWFTRAQTSVAGCGLVFLDPDNGLEVASVRPGSRMAGKYAGAAEVAAFLRAGTGVVLYQHRDRRPWPQQRAALMTRLAAAHPAEMSASILLFGSRMFVCMAPEPELAAAMEEAVIGLRARAASWHRARHLQVETITLGRA